MARTNEKVGDAPTGKEGRLSLGGAAGTVRDALMVVEGRWKLDILFRLFASPVLRFSELERGIPGISQKMLVQQLRQLERDGLVGRTVHAQVPPKVEYGLTALGEALRPALRLLLDWGALRAETRRGDA